MYLALKAEIIRGRREPGADEHMRAFVEYTARLVGKKREQPGNDLISQLSAIEEEEDQLDEAVLVSMKTLTTFPVAFKNGLGWSKSASVYDTIVHSASPCLPYDIAKQEV